MYVNSPKLIVTVLLFQCNFSYIVTSYNQNNYMNNLLETKEVSKYFGEFQALDAVSIQVPKHSIFGLLGPNGAGKTTLIRIINQITMPDHGIGTFRWRAFTAPPCAVHWLFARRTWAV